MSTIMGGLQLWVWVCHHESQSGVVWALTEESAREEVLSHLLFPDLPGSPHEYVVLDLPGSPHEYVVLDLQDLSQPGVWVVS